MKKLAALLLAAAACGPGLVEHPTVDQGVAPPPGGGGPPASPDTCLQSSGLVYCGGTTCQIYGALHCGPNTGVCEACPQGYTCSSGLCAQNSTCGQGLILGAGSCLNATQVAAGGNTTCAIAAQSGSTGVYCWGANESGQAGPAAPPVSSDTPAELATLRGATAVAVGAAHGCAILGGNVLCWGRNDAGQLGSGAPTGRATPVLVPGVGGATAISAGDRHSCAITADGAVCWGAIAGTFPQAQGATKIVAGGGHACAMLASSVLCWGANDAGQLGNGTQLDSSSPVTSLTGAMKDLTAGFHHTCALLAAGNGIDRNNALRCWGGNESGQIDANSVSGPNRLTPTTVTAFNSNTLPDQVGGGRAHICVRRGTDLVCFGDNSSGQRTVPVVAASSLATGGDHNCILDASTPNHLLHCWGSSASGELGPFGP